MVPTQHAPRSWSVLPMDLANTILRRLRNHADLVRFSAVCHHWRSCARRNTPPPQFPWLALPDRTFYSLPDSAFQPLPLHLDFHRQLPHAQSSCGQWLVFERIDGAYTLVSPFSMATTMALPRLSTEPLHVIRDMPEPFIRKLVVCSPNLVAAVVGAGQRRHELALCQPGAASWSVIADDQLTSLQDMLLYQGKLYALNGNNGRLISVSIGENRHTGEPTVSRVDRLMEGPSCHLMESPPHYLLESGGALLMVRRENPNMRDDLFNNWGDGSGGFQLVGLGLEMATKFKVFEADLASSRWRKVRSVGEDRVLFLGDWCSRAVRVPDQCKEYIIGDRIFFLDDRAARGYDSRYRKRMPFYCSIYDMRTRRSHTFLETKVRPLKGFPVTWLFHQSENMNNRSDMHMQQIHV